MKKCNCISAVKKVKIHNLYLVIAIVLGMVYCSLLPPYVVPDEPAHFQESYDVSNFILRTGKARPGWIYMRACDADTPFQAHPTTETYRAVYQSVFELCKDNTIVEEKRQSNDSNSIYYIVPGIGLTIGRVLHLGSVLTFWLARWCNYIVFMILIYWSLKKIPIGKNCVLIFSMLPMVMQQAMSVSYDCIAIGMAVFLISQCLSMAFKEEKICWKDLLLYGIPAAVLSGIKGGVYLPICCLALIIPMKKFASRKRYFMSAGIILAVLMVSFLAVNYPTLHSVMTKNQESTPVSGAETQEAEEDVSKDVFVTGKEQHYSVSDIISNPKHYVRVLLSTMKVYGDFYLQSMLGGSLGWLDIEVPWWILFGYLVLLLFAVMEPNDIVLSYRQKLWMIVVFGGVVVLVLTVMYVSWTPLNYPQVLGVQGRYFLPGLLLLPLAFKNRTILAKRDIRPVLVSVAMLLQACTCFFVLKAVLS